MPRRYLGVRPALWLLLLALVLATAYVWYEVYRQATEPPQREMNTIRT